MGQPERSIRIHAAAGADCGRCATTSQGPSCRGAGGVPCAAPELRGDRTQLLLALESLRRVVDPERGVDLIELQLVKSLRIEDGEAELTVTFPRGCGAARLMADEAFQVLRRVLPDTDVYVSHAA